MSPAPGFRQVRNIGDCVTTALDQADRLTRAGHQASTALIPVLGVGMGGGPVDPTVRLLLGAALDYLTAAPGTASPSGSGSDQTRDERGGNPLFSSSL